jgi:hypothetical protein
MDCNPNGRKAIILLMDCNPNGKKINKSSMDYSPPFAGLPFLVNGLFF